jgi:hypothetical protein
MIIGDVFVLISRRASNASGIAGKGSDRTFSCCFFQRTTNKKKERRPGGKKKTEKRERGTRKGLEGSGWCYPREDLQK